MKNRFFTVMLLLVFLVTLTGYAQATSPIETDKPALVYVDLRTSDDLNRFASTHLPMYTFLNGGLLTGADRAGQQRLQEAGLSFKVIDPDLRSGSYYQAETRPSHPFPDFASYGQVLFKTANGGLLRMDSSRVDALTQAGVELRLITLTPKPLPTAQSEAVSPDVVDPDPLIQGMIDQVSTDQIYAYDRGLAGEIPVWVDDGWYTITTRNTNSGTPIQKTTSYVGQHMSTDLGLGVEYYQWNNSTNPDVIGEIPGLTNPENIFIIGAHIDDVNGTPGADDNASGSVATLLAADILSQYQWGCTLRFAFWTGEEQGLLGSDAYAQHVYNSGENILGYLNLDMIAWNTPNSPASIYLGYRSSVPKSLVLANLFSDVVDAYNINLQPVIGTSYDGSSDHTSFLDRGYPAILAIEGNDDFNPYYHSAQDTPANTDPIYFTDFVKASIATYAHMSGCLIPSGVGYLDGHVTAASGGAPIEGARITAQDGQGHAYPATTDASGYYTSTLIANTYTVTASAYSYLPVSVSNVVIVTDTVNTQDFALISAPTYIVSGTVTETGTGLPLLAEVSFTGSPEVVWSDPATGFYQVDLPLGSYTMQLKSDLHRPQERNIVMDQNQTQNFVLELLPCILLVDDDNDAPDTTPYYSAALDALGYYYDIFDTVGADGPGMEGLKGYRMVLWYSGDTYGGSAGPNASDETNLTSYLYGGGKLFLDSQDYLYDLGLTTFGQTYLGISTYSNDLGNASIKYGVLGDPIGDGLGPYPLIYPSGFDDYGDIVIPGPGASVAFRTSPSGGNNLDVDKNGGAWKTIFFGTSWVPIYNNSATNGQAVLQRTIDWFGGCQPSTGWLDGYVTDADGSNPLEGVLVTASQGETVIQSITDPTGYYTMTLPAATYTVTASLDGYVTQSVSTIVVAGETTSIDFSLEAECSPVTGLDFTWLPTTPYNGDLITFTAAASGTEPIDFLWDFGDTFTDTGGIVTHTYTDAGIYTVELSASNACGDEMVSNNITILQYIWRFFLPIVNKN